MPKLIIMRGLPGSGKTTRALQILKEDGNAKRVNRDNLRAMLFGNTPWNGKQEKLVTDLERNMVTQILERNHNVIVDDTNLRSVQSWTDFVTKADHKVQVVDLTNISLETCIERDAVREGRARVGRGVIERMALDAGLINFRNEKKIAIVDIDGTVADMRRRIPFIESTPKDYFNFYSSVSADRPIETIVRTVRSLSLDHMIIFVSGRPMVETKHDINVGHITASWLEWNNIPFNHLFMRRGGDYRPDDLVKGEIFKRMLECGLDPNAVKIVIDDRERVCRVWRALNLPLLKVFNGHWVEMDGRISIDRGELHNAVSEIPYTDVRPEDF